MIMESVAWVAAALVFLTFFMKTMIPLRVVAVVSNVAFVFYALLGLYYGIFEKVLPILVLHLSLLPLNILRLHQMKQLVKEIRKAAAGGLPWEFLIPYMKKETFAKGETLFRKGDVADKVYFLRAGSILIPELTKELQEGTLFGELGIFTPFRTRSASAIFTETSVLYSIDRDDVIQLYCQNPRFGLFLVRLLSVYVSENMDTILELENQEMWTRVLARQPN